MADGVAVTTVLLLLMMVLLRVMRRCMTRSYIVAWWVQHLSNEERERGLKVEHLQEVKIFIRSNDLRLKLATVGLSKSWLGCFGFLYGHRRIKMSCRHCSMSGGAERGVGCERRHATRATWGRTSWFLRVSVLQSKAAMRKLGHGVPWWASNESKLITKINMSRHLPAGSGFPLEGYWGIEDGKSAGRNEQK